MFSATSKASFNTSTVALSYLFGSASAFFISSLADAIFSSKTPVSIVMSSFVPYTSSSVIETLLPAALVFKPSFGKDRRTYLAFFASSNLKSSTTLRSFEEFLFIVFTVSHVFLSAETSTV